ncbi:hypothetical protein AZE42_07535 [Rhizopogon vesiculosus]|uniref:Arrestin-like N-terminal domain-containing protein n=1 Tax=Rhizopogon vesiculosus TaxID=180088 RepID=A0A1J8QL01_9AGAM|nr:hypothetical protein AZE42_07535 [Rhizopogon vesiculosus]
MLRWLSLALVLAISRATFIEPSQKSNESGDALCRGRSWVRAPDMVPGDVIAGDVKVKLDGPCTDVESYALGLRFKERVFWKLRWASFAHILFPGSLDVPHCRRQDAPPPPERPTIRYSQLGRAFFDQTEWTVYDMALQNKDFWSVHEEERIAFEIKTDLVSVEELAGSLPTDFTTGFGILVPNTNYPPGIDYRNGSWVIANVGRSDTVSGEFVYEYFVEIKFRNGTTSEIPAGMTAFAPFYLPTEHDASPTNVSLTRQVPGLGSNVELDTLQSNYTIEVSDGTQIYQNSSVNIITATVHRTGYTNQTDAPIRLCTYLEPDANEWHPQELKNRSRVYTHAVSFKLRALVPSIQPVHSDFLPCLEINFTADATDFTQEGHISTTSSGPLSLPLYVDRGTVPDFSAYYRKLGHHIRLVLHVKPNPSEPWENEFEKQEWERKTKDSARSRPPSNLTLTPCRFLTGEVGIAVTPVQQQGHQAVRVTPVHYLSDKSRQPLFVDVSDIDYLRLMSPEERDLMAPLAQPSMNVFAEGEERSDRYFTAFDTQTPIYVGETWAKKVMPVVAEEHGTDHLFVVQ